MILASTGGIQRALESASGPVLFIVIIIALASVLAWTILITKLLVLATAHFRNHEYLDRFRSGARPLEVYTSDMEMRGSPLFSVYLAGARELCTHVLGSATRDEHLPVRLANAGRVHSSRMRGVRLAMERAIGEMTLRLEDGMVLLGSCVTIAPFLGLLGTAWGVMEAFEAMGAMGEEASLSVLAPMVSTALAPTILGLLVAVPSLLGYNIVRRSIRRMVRELDHHATELEAAFEREHVSHDPSSASETYETEETKLPEVPRVIEKEPVMTASEPVPEAKSPEKSEAPPEVELKPVPPVKSQPTVLPPPRVPEKVPENKPAQDTAVSLFAKLASDEPIPVGVGDKKRKKRLPKPPSTDGPMFAGQTKLLFEEESESEDDAKGEEA